MTSTLSPAGATFAFATRKKRPDVLGHAHVLDRVADRHALLARVAARAHVRGHRLGLRRPARDQVVGVRRALEAEQRLLRRDVAVVHEAEVVRQQRVRLVHVDEPAQEVRELALAVPRRVRLEPARVALEQQLRRARLLDLLPDRLAVARLELAEVGVLAVDVQAAPDLVDVGGLPEQARVLHHLRLAPAGLEHHLDARAVARLERARGKQREVALGVAEERRAAAEQRAVEIRVDAPQRHGARKLVDDVRWRWDTR